MTNENDARETDPALPVLTRRCPYTREQCRRYEAELLSARRLAAQGDAIQLPPLLVEYWYHRVTRCHRDREDLAWQQRMSAFVANHSSEEATS